MAQAILALVLLPDAGAAILHGGGTFGVLVSCMGSWRVRTWGYFGGVVVGQSFLVCPSSYGVSFKASLPGKQ